MVVNVAVCYIAFSILTSLTVTVGDLKNRSDLVLRPNFGLRTNLHKFFK